MIGGPSRSYPFSRIRLDPDPQYAELRRTEPVCPVQLPYGTAPQPMPQGGTVQPLPAYSPVSEAVVLHVDDHGFTKLGAITHPVTINDPGGGQIRRSLIIGSALWTLSDAGLKANDSTTLTPLAWVPFSPLAQ